MIRASVALASRWAWRRRRVARELAAGPPAYVALLLAHGLSSDDKRISATARARLDETDDQATINAVCALWDRTDDPGLAALIATQRWVADRPADLLVRSALLADRPTMIADHGSVPELVRMAGDETSPLRDQALDALSIIPAAGRDIVAWSALYGDETALRVALATGLAPANPTFRAFLWFVGEHFERWSDLDHDGSLLRAALGTAPQTVRDRVAGVARRAGRVDWLRVLVLGPRVRHLATLSAAEWEATAHLMVAARSWPDITTVVREASPERSVPLLAALERTGPPPVDPDVARLSELAARCGDLPFGPRLEHRQTIRMRSTAGPSTVGCGLVVRALQPGRVGMWDAASGDPFDELKQLQDQSVRVPLDTDGLTLGIEGSGGSYGLIVRDRGGFPRATRSLATPDTALALSRDGRTAAVCGPGANGVNVVNVVWTLPTLRNWTSVLMPGTGISALALAPDGSWIAVGQPDGRVRIWDVRTGAPRGEPLVLSGTVRHLAVLPDGDRIVAGTEFGRPGMTASSGEPVDTPAGPRWVPARTSAGEPIAGGTVLCWGPDERPGLWRLRGSRTGDTYGPRWQVVHGPDDLLVQDFADRTVVWGSALAALTRRPLAAIEPVEIDSYRRPAGPRPPEETAWLDVIEALVRWRMRWEIVLDDPPDAVPNPADIEVEVVD